jgi:DNA-binding transcriptional LysR family regulator
MNYALSMRVFVKVAEAGSFVRAAETIGMSASQVTRYVAGLEKHLGTRLLNRTTRSQSLTEFGRAYFERIVPILSDLDAVAQMVEARNEEPAGSLRIVAPVELGLHSFGVVLRSYTERYPNVVPDVTLVHRDIDLVKEGFDIGVLSAHKISDGSLVTRRMTTGHMFACATPGYLQKHGAPTHPEQLQDHAVLSLSVECGDNEWVFTSLDEKREVRLRPTNGTTANNTELLRQFVLLDMGVAILPSYLIGQDLEEGKLVRLLRSYRLPPIEVTIAYPSRDHLPSKVWTFAERLVEHFNQMLGDPGVSRVNAADRAQVLARSDALSAALMHT